MKPVVKIVCIPVPNKAIGFIDTEVEIALYLIGKLMYYICVRIIVSSKYYNKQEAKLIFIITCTM